MRFIQAIHQRDRMRYISIGYPSDRIRHIFRISLDRQDEAHIQDIIRQTG